MLTSVPNAGERADIVSYLATLPAAPGTRPARPVASVMPAPAPPALRTGPAAMGDYRDDGPGVRRQIKVGDLPSPFATPASRNSPMVADPPAGTSLHAPPGFTARLFLGGLTGPRLMRVAPNGDIFVVESNVGRIRVLRARDGAEQPARDEVFASGLHRPFGVAFFPAGDSPKWVYVANSESVVRFRYQPGDLVATGAPQVIVPKLADSSGGHWTRDVAFSRDGSAMYVSVGSASNVAETVPTRRPRRPSSGRRHTLSARRGGTKTGERTSWSSTPTAVIAGSSPRASAIASASPSPRRRVISGAPPTSATGLATTSSPTTPRACGAAPSMADPGTTSATTRIRATRASARTSRRRSASPMSCSPRTRLLCRSPSTTGARSRRRCGATRSSRSTGPGIVRFARATRSSVCVRATACPRASTGLLDGVRDRRRSRLGSACRRRGGTRRSLACERRRQRLRVARELRAFEVAGRQPHTRGVSGGTRRRVTRRGDTSP